MSQGAERANQKGDKEESESGEMGRGVKRGRKKDGGKESGTGKETTFCRVRFLGESVKQAMECVKCVYG